MTKFQLNIGKTKEICDCINEYLVKYAEKQESTYLTLKSINNTWTGVDSETFISLLDKNNINDIEIVDNVKKYNNKLLYFNLDIANLFKIYGYNIDKLDVRFDSIPIETILSQLYNAKEQINLSGRNFCGVGYSKMLIQCSSLNDVLEQIKIIEHDINELIKSISNVKNEMDNYISNYSDELSKMEIKIDNDKLLELMNGINSAHVKILSDDINISDKQKVSNISKINKMDEKLINSNEIDSQLID